MRKIKLRTGGSLNWFDKELNKKVKDLSNQNTAKGAEWVANDARSLVPVKTGTLRASIKVSNDIFNNSPNSYFVVVQGTGDYDRYYASFVELGTKTTEAHPYLRPALQMNLKRIAALYRGKLL